MISYDYASQSWRLTIEGFVTWHHSYASAERWKQRYWLAIGQAIVEASRQLGEDSSQLE